MWTTLPLPAVLHHHVNHRVAAKFCTCASAEFGPCLGHSVSAGGSCASLVDSSTCCCRALSAAAVSAGTAYIDAPNVAPICRSLGIDYAPALVGFEVQGGRMVPRIRGVVVCEVRHAHGAAGGLLQHGVLVRLACTKIVGEVLVSGTGIRGRHRPL
jgi:hypothetical protein